MTDLRALEAAATPGPWLTGTAIPSPGYDYSAALASGVVFGSEAAPHDAAFIAAARNALPYQLDVEEAAREVAGDTESARKFWALIEALDALDAHLRGETP